MIGPKHPILGASYVRDWFGGLPGAHVPNDDELVLVIDDEITPRRVLIYIAHRLSHDPFVARAWDAEHDRDMYTAIAGMNRRREHAQNEHARKNGFRVIRVWSECFATKSSRATVLRRLRNLLRAEETILFARVGVARTRKYKGIWDK